MTTPTEPTEPTGSTTPITVTLRIAGLYFKQSGIKLKKGDTIKNLLDFVCGPQNSVESKKGKLSYTFSTVFPLGGSQALASLVSFTHDFDGKFDIDGDPTTPGTGMTLGDKKRKPGIYTLQEFEFPNGVVAWQYYVITAKDRLPISSGEYQVSMGKPLGFEPFDDFKLEEDCTVIWRMVAIVRHPNG